MYECVYRIGREQRGVHTNMLVTTREGVLSDGDMAHSVLSHALWMVQEWNVNVTRVRVAPTLWRALDLPPDVGRHEFFTRVIPQCPLPLPQRVEIDRDDSLETENVAVLVQSDFPKKDRIVWVNRPGCSENDSVCAMAVFHDEA